MRNILKDPSDWQSILYNEEEKKKFIVSYKQASEQFNLVQQYYQYKWDDDLFGIDEHTWLSYVGAYRNLTRNDGPDEPDDFIKPLIGKTKLAGTQVINAENILELIGSKVSNVGGVQKVDEETLRIIYEQIQELSDMGEDNKSYLLKKFVDTELVPGNLSYNINFDEAFEMWKEDKIKAEVGVFSDNWGINSSWFYGVVSKFLASQTDEVSYKGELNDNVDFNEALDKSAGNRLRHMMILKDKLPEFIIEIKRKYN